MKIKILKGLLIALILLLAVLVQQAFAANKGIKKGIYVTTDTMALEKI